MPRRSLVIPCRNLTLAVAAVLGFGGHALAQSSTRSSVVQPRSMAPRSMAPRTSVQPRSSVVQPGSTSRATIASEVALEGYCPVCVVEMKKWVRGNPSIQTVYDGKTYYFPGEEQRQMFLASPDKFIPSLGGDCVVCMADMGARSPGSIRYSALSQGRLFLFPSEQMKMKFASNPRKYLEADVALGGKCTVCRVEMKQDVAGDPNIFVRRDGVKYQFASDDQRRMFLANPDKYVPEAMSSSGSTTKGSGSR